MIFRRAAAAKTAFSKMNLTAGGLLTDRPGESGNKSENFSKNYGNKMPNPFLSFFLSGERDNYLVTVFRASSLRSFRSFVSRTIYDFPTGLRFVEEEKTQARPIWRGLLDCLRD